MPSDQLAIIPNLKWKEQRHRDLKWIAPGTQSFELVVPSNHLIPCRLILPLPSIFPSIKVFSNESALPIRWPKYWSFSFNISPSNEHSGLTSWYSHLFQNFPQFIMIHTLKGIGIVNRADIDAFLELSCFFNEGFISPCSYLELCIQMGISFLFSFAFCFSSFHSYL